MGTLTLKKLPDDVRADFNKKAREKGLTQDEFFLEVWGAYNPVAKREDVADNIKKIVGVLIERNDNAKEWYQKRYLTPSLVCRQVDIIQAITGGKSINKTSVKNYFEAYKTEIEEHHKRHNLTDEVHNMKAAHAERRAQNAEGNE